MKQVISLTHGKISSIKTISLKIKDVFKDGDCIFVTIRDKSIEQTEEEQCKIYQKIFIKYGMIVLLEN